MEIAIKDLGDRYEKLSYDVANKSNLILEQMGKISAKAKNPILPLKDQLSTTDISAFQVLREKILLLEAQKIVESGYLRDAHVITEATKVAYTASQGVDINEHDPNFFYFGIVELMRLQHPADNVHLTKPKNPNDCNVEAGLQFNEQLALQQLGRLEPFRAVWQRVKAIADKYKLDIRDKEWISKIPSLQEEQIAQGDMLTIENSLRWREYINDLENLKALNHVAILGYLSDKDDLADAHSEAEISRLGTSWPEKLKKYDSWTKFLSGLQMMIAEKVPSDAGIEAQGLNNRLKQQGIIR